MRWYSRFPVCILTGLLVLAACAAHGQDKVLWLKTEWPPVFMQNRKGFGDEAMTWLLQRLPPDYTHEIRSLPLARLLKTMEDPQLTVCTSNLLRTPAREAQFRISRDIMRMPALGLVVRGADVDRFRTLRDASGMVEFRRLLLQENLDGAVNENRSYGTVLDNLLQAAPATAPIIRLPKTGNMVSMLAAHRLDWILLYPFEAIWLARQEQTVPVLSALPIAEIPGADLQSETARFQADLLPDSGRRDAGSTQIAQRRRIPAFGQPLAAVSQQQPVMRIGRCRPVEQCLEQAMQMRGAKQVIAAGDQRDALQRIVVAYAEMITGRNLLARQHHVAEASHQQLGHYRLCAGLLVMPVQRPVSGMPAGGSDIEAQRIGLARRDTLRAFGRAKMPAGAGIDRALETMGRMTGGGDLGLDLLAGAEAGIEQAALV